MLDCLCVVYVVLTSKTVPISVTQRLLYADAQFDMQHNTFIIQLANISLYSFRALTAFSTRRAPFGLTWLVQIAISSPLGFSALSLFPSPSPFHQTLDTLSARASTMPLPL